ncbi:unnamed protein product [Anisakis simplex]|uniref:C-type lectin domain-containing protein n=1 Tax=Anisakis simplex TaxID=6269 RepID=A0A3P6Q5U2_ANISI|nr:unnamed protein product [Anisakis simplex]
MLEQAILQTNQMDDDDDEVFEILDARSMGIRETSRVSSLHDCQKRCGGCASLVLYPDNTCVIFDYLTAVVMSSYGALCCVPRSNDSFVCDQCTSNSAMHTIGDSLVGHTNILGVWTLFTQTNSTYKTLPYECLATPLDYEEECQKEGAHLASIESVEEDQFVSSLASTSCNCKHIGLYSKSWPKQNFQWRDGIETNYTNWRFGEPYVKGHICVHIWKTKGWASASCTLRGIDSVGCCAVCKRN